MNLEKGDFIGRDARQVRAKQGQLEKLVTLVVDTEDLPAQGGASLIVDDTVVGTVTSGDWGHRVGANLDYALEMLARRLLGRRPQSSGFRVKARLKAAP